MKTFNKNNFSIASLVKREQRRDQVHITDNHTEVTNGHFLVRISSGEMKKEDLPESLAGLKPDETPINTVISCSSAKKIHDAIPVVTHRPILNTAWQGKNSDEAFIEFLATDLESWTPVVARRLEERFPDTDKVLAKEEPQVKIAFNVDYMKRLCEQLARMGIKTTKLNIYGEKEAMEMKAQTDDGQDVTILLMPVKRED